MTQISNKFAIALLLTSALTACNTTRSNTTSIESNISGIDTSSQNNASSSVGFLSKADIANGLSAKTSAADFTVSKNPKGGYDVVYNGETRVNTENSTNKIGDIKNILLTDHLYAQTINAFRTEHSNVLVSAKKTSDTETEFVFGTFGVTPNILPTKSATYEGRANPGFFYSSNVKLDLDFENSKLTGKFDKFKETIRTEGQFRVNSVEGQLNLSNGKIVNNAITADLTGQILSKNTTGTLKGNIYGTNGEEVAGTLTTSTDGQAAITGGFIAKQ